MPYYAPRAYSVDMGAPLRHKGHSTIHSTQGGC